MDLINPTKGKFVDADYTLKGLDAVLTINKKDLWIKDVQPIYTDEGLIGKNIPFFILASDNFLEIKKDKKTKLFQKDKKAKPILLSIDKDSFEVKGVISKADMASIADWGAIRAANDHWTRGPSIMDQIVGSPMMLIVVLLIGLIIAMKLGWVVL